MALGEKTKKNLEAAFAGESQANRRYTAYARQADAEGYPEVAALFRAIAEGETAHALKHLELLGAVSDTRANILTAIEGERYEVEEMYPRMARDARGEGHEDVARSFEAIARAEGIHAGRYRQALEQLESI